MIDDASADFKENKKSSVGSSKNLVFLNSELGVAKANPPEAKS